MARPVMLAQSKHSSLKGLVLSFVAWWQNSCGTVRKSPQSIRRAKEVQERLTFLSMVLLGQRTKAGGFWSVNF
jgi:hypothetical protein